MTEIPFKVPEMSLDLCPGAVDLGKLGMSSYFNTKGFCTSSANWATRIVPDVQRWLLY